MSSIALNSAANRVADQISAASRLIPFGMSPTKIVKTALAVITLNAAFLSKAKAEAFNWGKAVYCAVVCSFETASPPNYGYCFGRCMGTI